MNKAQLNSLYGIQVNTTQKLLLELQFNVSSMGFRYWIKAIRIYKQDGWRYGFTMQYLYNEIANYYGSTATRVERAMRTARATATEQIQKQYNYNKLTNKTVLELLTRNSLFIEKIDNHIPRIE